MVTKGTKFGKLTSLEDIACKSNRYVLVKCVCNKEKKVRIDKLLRNETKSCGNPICSGLFKDITGNIYGMLTVISKSEERDKHNRIKWLCRCECGIEKLMSSAQLRAGTAIHCGCKTAINKAKAYRNYESPVECALYRLYGNLRANAKKRNYSCELTFEDFKTSCFKPCFYCGRSQTNIQKFQYVEESVTIRYNGIDRLRNDIGYTIGNCVSCCHICNRAKSDMEIGYFIDWLDSLVEYRTNNKNYTKTGGY